MDNFFIEYRDPIFGLIILFSIVFIIAFTNYWWSIFKAKDQQHSIEKFIKRFEVAREKDAYKELLNSFKLSTDSLGLLAKSYVKSGDFETAIEIYLIALKQVKSRVEKKQILSELGKAYFKAGFLQRSSEVFLQSLKLAPRDKVSLKYLAVCHEALKSYDLSEDALNSLEELGSDVKAERAFLKANFIVEKVDLDLSQKLKELKELREDFPLANRFIIDLKKSKGVLEVDDFKIQNPKDVIDIAWFVSDEGLDLSLLDDKIYKSIAKVRRQLNEDIDIEIFELEVLDRLKEVKYHKADLSFEYTCEKCKQSFPMFFYRCPNCHSLSSMIIEPILVHKNYETYISFQ